MYYSIAIRVGKSALNEWWEGAKRKDSVVWS